MCLSYGSLINYYQLLFTMKLHGYLLSEIEDLIPFERDLFIKLLHDHLKDQKANESA